MDSISIKGEGDLMAPNSNLYTLTLKLDVGARLLIGSELVIDSFPASIIDG